MGTYPEEFSRLEAENKKLNILAEAAGKVFCWYYLFGETNSAARGLLADMGNKLREAGYLQWDKQNT